MTPEDVIATLCDTVTRWQRSADFWRDWAMKAGDEVARLGGHRPLDPWAWWATPPGQERTWRGGVWA